MHPDNNCLTEFELGAYIERRLDGTRILEIEQKLAGCADCRKELAALSADVGHPDDHAVPERVMRRAIEAYPGNGELYDIIIGLARDAAKLLHLSPGFQVMPAIAAAGVRGGKMVAPDTVMLNKSFEGRDAQIVIERLPGSTCILRIHIAEQDSGLPEDGMQVSLVAGSRELASGKTESGQAIFEDIRPGSYVVIFMKSRKKLSEIAIKIIA